MRATTLGPALGLALGSALGLALLVVAAATAPANAQSGFDRPGGDYTSGPVPSGDPAVCAAQCERDRHCRAWSFAYPTPAGEPAMCRLKHDITPRVPAGCCVSGVRGAGVVEPSLSGPLGGVEYSIDRVGGDLRSFETPSDHGKACAAACEAEAHCRAWTYQRSGYGSRAPRCYLKEAIKPPRHRPCCISGVVR
jgi:hypothetical protein